MHHHIAIYQPTCGTPFLNWLQVLKNHEHYLRNHDVRSGIANPFPNCLCLVPIDADHGPIHDILRLQEASRLWHRATQCPIEIDGVGGLHFPCIWILVVFQQPADTLWGHASRALVESLDWIHIPSLMDTVRLWYLARNRKQLRALTPDVCDSPDDWFWVIGVPLSRVSEEQFWVLWNELPLHSDRMGWW